jgi:predicted RNA-binding Zn ribbon-like protein
MHPRPVERSEWKPVGGVLCLDFANTARWHASEHPVETLASYDDLIRWCRRAGVLDRVGAEALHRRAGHRRAAARAALRRAIAVRELLYRLVVALMRGERPRTSELAAFSRELRRAFTHVQVRIARGRLARGWPRRTDRLDAPLWPILDSALQMLTSGDRDRIRQCADDRGCGWLFLDTTRNGSRRWCDMGDCGNRAKAGRHRSRVRAATARAGPGAREFRSRPRGG